MTVNTNETRKTYNGNGVTTAFATPQFLANADLVVYVDGVLQAITTHYTVAGAGVPAGGTVTFVTAPPVGTSNVVIIRDPALTQLLDLVENDANPAETREAAFDKLTMIAQRLAEYVSRVVRLSDVDVTAGLILPLAADRASKYLAFDASGDVMVSAGAAGAYPVTAFMGTVLDDDTATEALATLGLATGGALVTNSANQAVGGAMAFDTEIYDTAGIHDTAVNNSRLTVPAGITKVRLTACIETEASASTYLMVRILKNNSIVAGLPSSKIAPIGTANNLIAVHSAPVDAVAGDYFTVNVYTSAGTENVYAQSASFSTWFAMELVS